MKTLFLVGPHASGKTYSTKEAIKRMGLQNTTMIDTGPIMRKLHKESAPTKTINVWVEDLEKKYGKGITSKLICDEIKRIMDSVDSENCIIVIGFRSIEGLMYTIETLNITDYNILYVDASFELLYQNYSSREGNKKTREEFAVYLQEELNSGLGVLRDMALNNNGMIDYYYRDSNDDDFENYLLQYLAPGKILKKGEKNG